MLRFNTETSEAWDAWFARAGRVDELAPPNPASDMRNQPHLGATSLQPRDAFGVLQPVRHVDGRLLDLLGPASAPVRTTTGNVSFHRENVAGLGAPPVVPLAPRQSAAPTIIDVDRPATLNGAHSPWGTR